MEIPCAGDLRRHHALEARAIEAHRETVREQTCRVKDARERSIERGEHARHVFARGDIGAMNADARTESFEACDRRRLRFVRHAASTDERELACALRDEPRRERETEVPEAAGDEERSVPTRRFSCAR